MQLDKTSTKILKFIRDDAPTSTEDISAFVSNKALAESCILSLIRKNYIRGLTPVSCHTHNGLQSAFASPYAITADGLAYLETIKAEKTSKKQKFFNDLIFALIGAVLSNADRFYTFIIELINTLLTS